MDPLSAWRRGRLDALAKVRGGNAVLGRELGYRDGAFVGQMISGARPITEKTVLKAEALPGAAGWFDPTHAKRAQPIDLDKHPELTPIRSVKLRVRGGITGFAVEPDDADGQPIFFRADWMAQRGYKPYDLLAIKVSGQSMEPSLYAGDTVVINTADTNPRDGEVYAVNYEGEPMVKRLVRDGGVWWLVSDNPDQTRHPRKQWVDHTSFLVGRVIHKQSERI